MVWVRVRFSGNIKLKEDKVWRNLGNKIRKV